MNGTMLLEHAAGVIEQRESIYGPPEALFAHIAARWSLVLRITARRKWRSVCSI